MNYALYLARKMSLSGNGKQSSPAIKVAVAAVALSVAVMLAAIAIVLGFKREIRDKVVGFNSHISLYSQAMGADDNNLITLTPTLRDILDNQPYISDYSLEASIPAILKTPDNFKGVYLRSLNGAAIRKFIGENVESGKLPEYADSAKGKSSQGIVISRIAADQLGLKAGDTIETYFITDNVRVRKLKVAAVYNSHFDMYDDVFVYGDLGLIQKIAGIEENQGISLSVTTDDFSRVEENSEKLHNTLTEAMADGRLYRYYQVDNARHQGAGYFQWLDLLDTNVAVILTLMVFVSVMTLISGLLILILDRKHFIGLVRAMGAPIKKVRKIFVYLALKVGLTGLLIGNAVMLLFLWAQDKWHFLPLDPEAYYIDFVPIELNWKAILLLNAGVVAVLWLCLILPSMFVAKISPAETMKSE